MSSVPITRLTPEEFLERERVAEEKHEYWYGEAFAMAGGSVPHSFVISNVVRWDELITYPDVTVLCGKPEYADDHKDTLTNPAMVVDVLSPSTRKSDRGDKVFLYRQVPSMREILLVEPEPTMIEHYSKLPNGRWELETITDRFGIIQLPNLNQALPVAEIYRDVEILFA
jgi:Uma2 family endonuclease